MTASIGIVERPVAGTLYGGHLHPCRADGDLYFTMSWGPYNVRLMPTELA